MCRKKEVDTLPWPPQSLDLNLIENIWEDMETYLEKRYGRVASREELIRAVEEAWEAIPNGRFIDLCRTFPPQPISSLSGYDPGDLGRKLTDITSLLIAAELVSKLHKMNKQLCPSVLTTMSYVKAEQTNYGRWVMRMTNHLQREDLSDVTTEDEPMLERPNSGTTDEKYEEKLDRYQAQR
ncbi:hypothetical protein HOY80DRAFT_1063546 [Tuber brumale]|nr:hypothetical protein HOY80DRAFT_1063546 [Tuber brumale]